MLTSEEVFEGEFHFWDAFAYPKEPEPEPELEPEDPSQKFSLPIAQRVHSLTARSLKRTHWLYEPDSFVPAAQLVEAYNHHAQRMTGTGHAAYSSTVSTGTSTAEPQLYYIHTDHLGTPQELTDRDGNLQWTGHYRAWGELAKANDSDGNAAHVEMPLRFQGQYCDAETGLHYNRHRYYDPQLGRFTTQDPISLAGGINLYQYAPNPVQWVDALGLQRLNQKCPSGTGDNIPKLDRSQLPREERNALDRTVDHIDNGTKPNDATAKRWGINFENRRGDLPGGKYENSPYKEYRVSPSPDTPEGKPGARRVLLNNDTGQKYYTQDHYKTFMEI